MLMDRNPGYVVESRSIYHEAMANIGKPSFLHSLNDSHCTASVAATSTSSLYLHPAMALKPLKSLFPQIDPNPNANLLPESHLADPATWKRMPKNMSAALCCHNRYFEFLTI